MVSAAVLSIISVIIVSAISLIGVVLLSFAQKKLKSFLLYFVSFAAGALMGDAFIHLLPEVVGQGLKIELVGMYILSGIVASFVVEKLLHWHHSHFPHDHHHVERFAYMNLFGDAAHNFIDGLVIAAAYLASVPVGIATTVAVVFHEIPQELGDYAVLIHGGFSRKKALMVNFGVAVIAVVGAVVALVASTYILGLTNFLVAFAAGGFIYIAGTDLIPELHKKFDTKSSVLQLIAFLLGIGAMWLLIFLE